MDRNNLKRKRRDSDGDNFDGAAPRQILPVASHLPADFNGIPQDGAQYLFTVRRAYAALPRLKVAPVIPAPKPARQAAWVLNAKAHSHARRQADQIAACGTSNDVGMNANVPSDEWKEVFVTRFRRFRENVRQTADSPTQMPITRYPKVTDRAKWWSFINGRPESSAAAGVRSTSGQEDASYDEDIIPTERDDPMEDGALTSGSAIASRPAPPTTGILRTFDQKGVLHLIMYFGYWIPQILHPPSPTSPSFPSEPAVPPLYAQWIFSLLAYLDDRLMSNEIHTLRTLARACGEVIRKSFDVPANEARSATLRDERDACWMILAAIGDVWGQSDLWDETRAVVLTRT